MRQTPKVVDAGLQRIADLETLIREGHPAVVLESGASLEEVDRARTEAQQLAATIGERLRAEYLARQQR